MNTLWTATLTYREPPESKYVEYRKTNTITFSSTTVDNVLSSVAAWVIRLSFHLDSDQYEVVLTKEVIGGGR